MKKTITYLTVFTLAFFLLQQGFCQVSVPAPSPFAKLTTTVGLTDVEIEYSRPSKKGREIFGGLVPYDVAWRTGANASTKIMFSDDVNLGGYDIPAGKYALFSIPSKTEWTIIIHKNLTLNAPSGENYSPDFDLIRFNVKPQTISDPVETFTINISNNTMDMASLDLVWDKTKISMPIKVNVDEKVMASIEKTFDPPGSQFYRAATYYHESGKDLKKALQMVSTAIEKYEAAGSKPYWVYRRQALIQADMDDYKSAIASAERSEGLAEEAGNNDYIRMNNESIEKWKKMKK